MVFSADQENSYFTIHPVVDVSNIVSRVYDRIGEKTLVKIECLNDVSRMCSTSIRLKSVVNTVLKTNQLSNLSGVTLSNDNLHDVYNQDHAPECVFNKFFLNDDHQRLTHPNH